MTADQVRQLEGMTVDERRELVRAVLRDAHLRGGAARFGSIGEDGRIGG